ncbi:MAG: hypothetical protein COX12_01515 [Candidatus Brennerbacteria bacterium CG23_combo_of_CG06-09_8_20_14_all_44_41]|uniref:Uncharacterized protein n=1 Tax=Candidatus Brennerbacteria bacterium CG_4_9_14_3_um_filter_43_9 TaxID=1974522 RepID=A0A2M8C2W3_9BACT|nr:MAG: hypothetical protein AUJ43_02350 [Parcubacteria group bacterium CG1_02_44_31]PIP50396.1 MAG: hypothetical protein COX12_01515 [Candidatus Brennerbacteria bacterium CG23_combo_of_CG06-09_8_20_14_all_44_41]PJA18968.1 MAG: hypothetical protein COX61_02440 [Candidatus Brennerbacteria bacterium CG_4_10_14_0_2_um_filter_43_14]PJB50438.1 MAG: hypothetical protein CO102_01130 [Candidatus Brennerbacteria bacterium CG_4_9_14_3_um_filter_43_9]
MSKTLRILIVLVILSVILMGIARIIIEKRNIQGQNALQQSGSGIVGPTDTPHVKGPTAPPPGIQ